MTIILYKQEKLRVTELVIGLRKAVRNSFLENQIPVKQLYCLNWFPVGLQVQ